MKPDLDKLLSLSELLESRAAWLPENTFAIFPDTTISYGELLRQSSRLAKGLIADGLKPGAHVAILMPNCLHFLLAHFAVQLAGGKSILLNARFKRHELAYVAAHCDASVLITTDCIDEHVNFTRLLSETFPELATAAADNVAIPGVPLLRRIVLFGNKTWNAALPSQRLVELGQSVSDATLAKAHAGQDPEDVALMLYTSGTTATPKACEISHASPQRSWLIYSKSVNLSEGEQVWDPMPFFHCGGIGLMTGIMARGATIMTTPYFDPEQVAELIERYQIQHLYPGFHTLSVPVLQSSHYNRERWSRFVKTMVNVGPAGTQYAIRDMLPAHVPVMNLFGMSESSGLLTLSPPDAPEDMRLTSSGKPLYGAEVRVVDPETLQDVPAGTQGEIMFRGAGAFSGYYKDPDATRATILPGGWVRTGDLGMYDKDGWLFFRGRLKDMLKVGGENVAAGEVKSFLSSHPAVKFVQVIGKPDDRMTEVPVAFVELNPGTTASEDDIIAFCKGKIANYKIPRQVVFVTEWPMSATKVQKFKLKELLTG